MKIVTVVALAARTPSWLAESESEYAARIAGFYLQTHVVKPAATAKKTAAAMLAKMPPKARLFLLDAAGETMDSAAFTAKLRAFLADSRPPVFVVGGAEGLPPPLRTRAEGFISLSPLTFAHAAARLILAEQLFRADCTMRNHPYPR
ncbi:MAG: 23S rRNA (pseudouridine(1915)-N(3))-methyltransferase RlmH [Gammaproteobacteria bacterium]